MIKITYSENISNEYYNKLNDFKYNGKTLEERYNIYFKNEYDCSLIDIICGQFEKLEFIKSSIGNKSNEKYKINELFNYKNKRNTISSFFIKKIRPHVCYFCNVNFINSYQESADKEKDTFTFDHFIDKGNHPYLALSLYNLVPSCSTCNRLKDNENITGVSPTSSKFNFNEKVKFKTFISKENNSFQIKKENDFDLHLKEDFSDEYKKYMDVFKLDERYQYHKYKVLEMIKKRKKYPDSRIRELAKISQRTEQEVKKDLFGDYLFKDGLHKRPLSKLIRDIAYELGLVSDSEHLEILNNLSSK